MPDSIAISDGGANGGGFATVGAGAFPNGRNVGHFQINDDFSWTKGTHTFKAGVNARYDQYTYTSIASGAFLGAYSLGDLSDFANGKLGDTGNALSSFTQSFPLYGALHFRFPSADFYVSDEWAVTKNLKLTYGLRIEEDFNPTCIEKCFVLTNVPFDSPSYQGGASVPYNTTLTKSSNLFYNAEAPIVQPRIGFAYKPAFGNNKTVIRGGIGLFSTNYTDGIGGTLANQVPNKFAPDRVDLRNGRTDRRSHQLGLHCPGFGERIRGWVYLRLYPGADPDRGKAGHVQHSQHHLVPVHFSGPPYARVELRDPAGDHGSQHVHSLLCGQPRLRYSGDRERQYVRQLHQHQELRGPYGGLPTAAPDGRFVTVTQYYNNGISNYNSLTLQFRHMFSYGLSAQIHYTWSHDLGTIAYENPFNLSNSYGSLGFDNRHQAAADVLWNQPFKSSNKAVNALISGWTVGLKTYIYSGAPFSVTDSKIATDVNASGVLTPLADLVVPSAFGTHCNGGNAIGTPCLAKSDFATYPSSGISSPIQTDWGNIAPNSFRGPGYFDLDATLQRSFTIREKVKFVFGMQAYNVLNHPNFANPSGSVTSGAFGEITSTLGPPTSIYGTSQGASVSGRLAIVTGTFTF